MLVKVARQIARGSFTVPCGINQISNKFSASTRNNTTTTNNNNNNNTTFIGEERREQNTEGSQHTESLGKEKVFSIPNRISAMRLLHHGRAPFVCVCVSASSTLKKEGEDWSLGKFGNGQLVAFTLGTNRHSVH